MIWMSRENYRICLWPCCEFGLFMSTSSSLSNYYLKLSLCLNKRGTPQSTATECKNGDILWSFQSNNHGSYLFASSDAYICVSKLTIIGSDNGLSPDRRHAIIWTNAGILLIWTLGTNFSEILSEIHTFSFKKMHLKMSSAKWHLSVSASKS